MEAWLPFLSADSYWVYPLLAVLGAFAGALNVLAGGGSFLTLPLLIFLGLPAGIANGTNRVGILMQNVSAVWSFHRSDVLDRRSVFWAAGPATVGAVIGTFIALHTGDDDFQRILAFLMVAVTLASFWTPKRSEQGSETDGASVELSSKPPVELGSKLPVELSSKPPVELSSKPPVELSSKPPVELSSTRYSMLAAGFFAVGLYGGFVQAGVGFLILAATTFAGLDLVRGNAVKVLSVLCFTVLSLAIFAWNGKVHWPYGLALALGTTVGGRLGARWTILKGHRWLKRLVTFAVLVFAARLWWAQA